MHGENFLPRSLPEELSSVHVILFCSEVRNGGITWKTSNNHEVMYLGVSIVGAIRGAGYEWRWKHVSNSICRRRDAEERTEKRAAR